MTVRQDYDHILNPLKGWVPGNMGAVEYRARLAAAVTIDPVYAGRVVHLNEDGEFEMGCVGPQMAIFLFQNSDDPDVSIDAGVHDGAAFGPDGFASGLVAGACYEVQTTEFDTAQDYLPNQPLRAVADNTDATTGGRLTNQGVTVGSNAYCGLVSKGAETNAWGVEILNLWTVYVPHASA